MSFSSEYAALRKKRKKNEEEEASGTSAKTSKKSSFAEQYAELRSKRSSSVAEDDDIAPVRNYGTRLYSNGIYTFALDDIAPVTDDRETYAKTLAYRKFDEQQAMLKLAFKKKLEDEAAKDPANRIEQIREANKGKTQEQIKMESQFSAIAAENEAKKAEEEKKKAFESMIENENNKPANESMIENENNKPAKQGVIRREFEKPMLKWKQSIAEQKEAQEEAQEEEKRTWFQAEAFEDGYDFGDVTKSVGATLGDIGVNAFQGLASMGEGIIDFSIYAADLTRVKKRPIFYNAQTGEKFDIDEDLREWAQKDVVGDFVAPAKEWLDGASFLGDKSDSVAQGLGQIAGIYLTGGLGEAAGLGSAGATALTTGMMFASSAGSGIGEAYASGASDEQAMAYGVLKGLADAGSELIFGGLGKGVNALGVNRGISSLDDMFAKKLSDGISKQVVKNFVEFGVKSSAEGFEEVLAGLGTAVAQKLTYMSDAELMELIEDQDLFEQFVIGTVTSALVQSGYIPGTKKGSLRESNKTGRDFITGYTQSDQSVIDRVFEDRLSEMEEAGEELSEKDKKKLLEEVQSDVKRGYIDTDKIEEILGGDKYTAWKDADRKESELIEEYEKLADTPSGELSRNQQKRLDELEGQLENLRGKTESNRLYGELTGYVSEQLDNSKLKDSKLKDIYNDKVSRRTKFTADVSKYSSEAARRSIQNLIDTGYANNSKEMHEFADNVAKLAERTGKVFSFVNDEQIRQMGKAVEGRRVNGFVTEDGIAVNLDSRKAWEFVVGHEVTHVLEGLNSYTELHDALKEYATQRGEWDSRLKELTELYEGQDADVEAELVADLVGEYLFGDTDFISSLAVKNPNVVQKIYAAIKHLLKTVTAGSKQARQLERAKYAFEKAMREAGKAKVEGTEYSLSSIDGIDYVKAEKNIFTKEDGTLASEREVFNSLVGDTIPLPDGDVEIIKRLPGKSMYNELFRRYPKQIQNVKNPKQLNTDVNYNITELIGNSKADALNIPDVDGRHGKQGIVTFDKRSVKFYDGNKAYTIEFSIASLQNGKKIAYAKKLYGYDAKLTKKIQAAEAMSKQSQLNQQPVSDNSISQNSEKSTGNSKKFSDKSKNFFDDIEGESGYIEDSGTIDELLPYKSSLSYENEADANADKRLNPLEDLLPVREDVTDNNVGSNVQESAKDAQTVAEDDVMPMPEAEQRIDLKYLMEEDDTLPVREDVQAEAETADVPTPEAAEATPITTVGERLSAKKGNYETELEANKANRAQAWANYDAAIAEAQAEYDGLKNKNTKRANNLLRRIDRYMRQQKNVDADYAKRISDIESRIGRTSEKIELNEQRKAQLASDIASLNMPTQERKISDKIAKSLTKESGVNQKKEQRGILSLVKEYVLDNGMVFEDESKKHHNRQLEADWNMIRNARSMAQRFLKKSVNGRRSIVDIEAEVRKKGLTQDFYDYMHHMLNVDRMSLESKAQAKIADIIANNPVLGTLLSRNQSTGDILNDPLFKQNADTLKADVDKILKLKETKNHLVFGDPITSEISAEEAAKLEKAHPEFKSYAEEIYANIRQLRNMLVEEGIITPETAELWEEMYPHYVPLRRAKKRGGGEEYGRRMGVNAPLKRAEGGNTDIEPLFNTIALRAEQTYKAVLKNRFGLELMNTIQTPIVEADNKLGVKIDTPDGVENIDSLLMPGDGENAPTFTVFENGERVTFEITEEMYDAMRPTGDALSYTSKGLQAVSNLMRSLLTEYNLPFMVGNAIKDAQDILMNSQHPARTYAAIPKAIAQIASKGKYLTEYMDYGGQSLSFFDKQKMEFVKKNVPKEVFMTLTGLNAISKANNVVELMPRLAEYIASREAGRSIEISMLDAARVTTNFAAGGKLTKLVNRNGATFLNASVQGFMQNVRNIREAKMNGLKGWAGLAARTILAGAPALILNNLIWDDDDEYEELSDYIKQNYYIVGKFGDGKFVRIPKGRTVAVIQDAFMQISNAITGDDEVDFESFAQLVINNLVPNNPYEDNVASPIVKMMMNETWYGGDLVPTRLQDSPKAEQYDETTDAISKWLGEKLNFSPYKINYLLDQYTGGIGDILLPMITPESETGDDSVMDYVTAPFRDKFTTDSVLKNQNVSDFYDLKDELNVNANSSKATDDDVLKNKYMNSMSDRISELQKQKREIQARNDLSKSEKYEMTRDLQKEIVALTKEAIDSYENLNQVDGNHTEIGGYYYEWYTPEEGDPYWRKMTDSQKTKYLLTKDADGHYVTDGNVHYRLDEDGEWTKISDKDLARQNEVTKELGITPDEYWSKTETSFFPVKNGEYEYAYENPEKYTVAKAVGGYDSYKSYSKELSGIKADKDENGKSISGSRKEKVLDYINGLDIDYGEKIILFKNEYNADDTYNYDIIDYLNSRDDISYSEMETILKELGFDVDSDGNVSW